MMKAGTLNSEQATDAVNADTITADEMFDYFEYGTCPRS
jgi:hypothetical protein